MRKMRGRVVAFFVVVSVFAALVLFRNSAESRFLREVDQLTLGEDFQVGQLRQFGAMTSVCIVSPYAISASRREDDLKKIFGEIEIRDWSDKIVANANDDSRWTLYAIHNNAIATAIRIPSNRIVRLGGGRSGCYDAHALCIQRSVADTSSVIFHLCSQSQGGNQ